MSIQIIHLAVHELCHVILKKKKVSLVPTSTFKVLVVKPGTDRDKSLIILRLALFWSLGERTKAHYLKAILAFQFTTELSMTRNTN